MALRPDPTFYPSPKLAMEGPPEEFAYTALLTGDLSKPDALAVIDVKRGSSTYGQIVHTWTMPYKGDEFHHFGWNARSFGPVAACRPRFPRAALSDHSGHPLIARLCGGVPSPIPPKVTKYHKIIEPEEIFRKTGYSRPHTVHCGPEGIYVITCGGGVEDGSDGPPGVFIMDCETFEVLGRWEYRSRTAKAALRFLVEPAARLHGVKRMGAAAAIRGRDCPAGPALEQIRPPSPLLAPAYPGAMCRRSISAPLILWPEKSARRMIRSANMVFWAW